MIGDFNDLMRANEKVGGVPQPNYKLIGFSNAVSSCGLNDIGMSRYPFTWERSRGT